MGISSIGIVIGFRRRNVAQRRLRMIQNELGRRDLPLHQQTKRDYLIPLAVLGVTTLISAGIVSWLDVSPLLGTLDPQSALSFVQSIFVPDIAACATAYEQLGEQAAGMLGAELADQHVIARAVPATGRKTEWQKKLVRSKSMMDIITHA